MPNHRVTFEFEQSVVLPGSPAPSTAGAKYGWSESWYQNIDVGDSDAAFFANILASSRRAVLTSGWALIAARVSRLDAGANLMRRGQLIFYDPPGSAGYYPGVNQDEQPYDGLILSVQSDSGNFRHTAIRGIGNNVVSAGGRYLAPAGFIAQFNLFSRNLRALTNPGDPANIPPYALRIRSLTADVQVVAVSTSGPAIGGFTPTQLQPVLTVVAAGGIFNLSTIFLRRFADLPQMNGSWIITGVNIPGGVGQLQLRAKRRTRIQGNSVTGGVGKVYQYALNSIVSVRPEYGSSRRTGRPLQLVRGRRSNQNLSL